MVNWKMLLDMKSGAGAQKVRTDLESVLNHNLKAEYMRQAFSARGTYTFPAIQMEVPGSDAVAETREPQCP